MNYCIWEAGGVGQLHPVNYWYAHEEKLKGELNFLQNSSRLREEIRGLHFNTN